MGRNTKTSHTMTSLLKLCLLAIFTLVGANPNQWTDICANSNWASETCCSASVTGTMNGYEFEWLDESISWDTAQDICRREDDLSDSTLVMFESYAKWTCIYQWLTQESQLDSTYHPYGIGLKQGSGLDNLYYWDSPDGSSPLPSYQFPWANGYPQSTGCGYMDVGYGASEGGYFKDTDCYNGMAVYPLCQRTKTACHGVNLSEGDSCSTTNDCCPSGSTCGSADTTSCACGENTNHGTTCGSCVPNGQKPAGNVATECCSGIMNPAADGYCSPTAP